MTANQTIDGVPRERLEDAARAARIAGYTGLAEELRALLDAPQVESELSRMTRRCQNAELALKVQTENYEALKAAQPQGVPEIPKHLNYATVLVLQEGESEYGEALYGRDGEFRFGYDESALTDVEKWMPLPRREAPAPESINHGACVDFRLLLNKYIEHVGQCEGVDFIDDIGGAYGSDVPFDPAEIAELERLQECPMKELVSLPNDSDTNVPLIGLMPKGSAKFTYGRAVQCPNCGDSERVVLSKDDTGVLMGPCPHCRPKPPPAGSDRVSMKGAMIHGNGGPNPITYTGNGAIVNLDGYVLYAPGAEPVAIVMPDRMVPRDSCDSESNQWNACLDEVTRLNTKE